MFANWTQDARIRRHASFVDWADKTMCYRKKDILSNHTMECEFIKQTPQCEQGVRSVNYLEFLICTLDIDAYYIGNVEFSLLCIVIALFYFFFCYLISVYFLKPNIYVLVDVTRISPYVLGSCVLGFFISAADVFRVIAFCWYGNYNGTFFLSSMVGKSFSAIAIGFSVLSFIGEEKHLVGHRVIRNFTIIVVTLVYSITVLSRKMFNENLPVNEQVEVNFDYHAAAILIFGVSYTLAMIMISRKTEPTNFSRRSEEFVPDDNDKISLAKLSLKRTLLPYKNINLSKTINTLLVPLWMFIAVQVPVVDISRPLHGWCKYVNSFSFLSIILAVKAMKLSNVVFYLSMCIAVFLMVFSLLCTPNGKYPKRHKVMALVGLTNGLLLYHTVCSELDVFLMQIIMFIGNASINTIALVIGSLQPVLMTMILMYQACKESHEEFAKGLLMGLSMIGFFSIIPTAAFQVCYSSKIQITITDHTYTCFFFTLITTTIALLGLSSTNFVLRASHGIFLVSMYSIYILVLLLSVNQIVHPYGTMHSLSFISTVIRAPWA